MSDSPKRGAKVIGHPEEHTIRQLLQSGYSPERIVRWLRSNCPDHMVSDETLRSYRTNYLDPSEVLPASVYEKHLKGLDVKVDTLQELYNAIYHQKRRIAHLFDLEEASTIALVDTRREMETLAKMCATTFKLEMDLGVRKRAPVVGVELVYDVETLLDRVLKQKFLLADNR